MLQIRKHILFYSIIAMMASLFISRAALSVTTIAFLVLCFSHANIKEQLKTFISTPILWSISLLFVIPLITGSWSDNNHEWLNNLRTKLPLLLMPLAIAGPFGFSRKQWAALAIIFIGLITAGTFWCMFHYAGNMQAVNEGYLRATSILTPLENDHVRFSWLVNFAVLLTGWTWWHNKERKHSWCYLLIIAWLVAFLHILAARTGLLSFYIALFATVCWLLFKRAKPLQGVAWLLLLLILPVAAYFILPTFRNKVKYFRYDFEYVKDAHYLPGGNDAIRTISLKAGWNIMQKNAVKGVGFGDIPAETTKWYDAHYPQMSESEKILPSSQWLIYGSGAGWPGFLLFTWVVLLAPLITVKNRGQWILLNILAAFGFVFDIGLEVQFGVFIYSFTLLLCWKWFRSES